MCNYEGISLPGTFEVSSFLYDRIFIFFAVFPTYCDFFFNVVVLRFTVKKLCVMGIFFLTKLTKIPISIYIIILEKKAARQSSGVSGAFRP
jgi:hypothetical protein